MSAEIQDAASVPVRNFLAESNANAKIVGRTMRRSVHMSLPGALYTLAFPAFVGARSRTRVPAT